VSLFFFSSSMVPAACKRAGSVRLPAGEAWLAPAFDLGGNTDQEESL
jgi:hypothetical protein